LESDANATLGVLRRESPSDYEAGSVLEIDAGLVGKLHEHYIGD